MAVKTERILILCKTYPSPSAKHAETSCVAGINEDGRLIRIYPVPFRLIGDDQQFKKWQWIEAKIEKSKKDHRFESYKIFIDTISCIGNPVPPTDGWKLRYKYIYKSERYSDFSLLEQDRPIKGNTLGFLNPSRLIGLDIKPADTPDWTDEEKSKLLALQSQSNLFDEQERRSILTLRKLPFDFYYRYECETPNGIFSYRHKIVDWEAGALYWNVRARYKDNWEKPFRHKLETEFSRKDLLFLMGTIHRFPDQWLIISLIYPPKQPHPENSQGSLFDL